MWIIKEAGSTESESLSEKTTQERTQNMKRQNYKVGMVLMASAALLAANLLAGEKETGGTQTIKGEVVDLMCYLDHGARGEKHAGCAEKCIKGGGPVGILTSDKQLYLIVGDHKPMNDELAAHASKTITVKGKVVERDGMKMIENAEIVM
jgi:hypothetical protein